MGKQNLIFLFSAVSAYSLLANAAHAGVSGQIGSEQSLLFGAQGNLFLIYFYIFFIYQMLPCGRGRNLMGLVLQGAQT